MTKAEWIARCKAQYIKRAGLTEDQGQAAAEATHRAESDMGFEDDLSPEEAADNDTAYWTDDGD